jgi:hypothetical protein
LWAISAEVTVIAAGVAGARFSFPTRRDIGAFATVVAFLATLEARAAGSIGAVAFLNRLIFHGDCEDFSRLLLVSPKKERKREDRERTTFCDEATKKHSAVVFSY